MMNRNFDELYNDIVENNALAIDLSIKNLKKAKRKNLILAIVITAIVDIILYIFFFSRIDEGFFWIPFLLVFSIILVTIIYAIATNKSSKQYSDTFKSHIMPPILKNFVSELQYSPNQKIESDMYDSIGYQEYYNRYYGDDLTTGKLGAKYDFEMSNLNIEHEESHTDSEGHTHTTITTVFRGLLAKINLPVSLKSELRIMDNYSIRKSSKLKMDSTEFEN